MGGRKGKKKPVKNVSAQKKPVKNVSAQKKDDTSNPQSLNEKQSNDVSVQKEDDTFTSEQVLNEKQLKEELSLKKKVLTSLCDAEGHRLEDVCKHLSIDMSRCRDIVKSCIEMLWSSLDNVPDECCNLFKIKPVQTILLEGISATATDACVPVEQVVDVLRKHVKDERRLISNIVNKYELQVKDVEEQKGDWDANVTSRRRQQHIKFLNIKKTIDDIENINNVNLVKECLRKYNGFINSLEELISEEDSKNEPNPPLQLH